MPFPRYRLLKEGGGGGQGYAKFAYNSGTDKDNPNPISDLESADQKPLGHKVHKMKKALSQAVSEISRFKGKWGGRGQ